MSDGIPTFQEFVLHLMDYSHGTLHEAADGLTAEQLYFQPAPASNSIGWLIWHMSRMKDLHTGSVIDETDLWRTEGWAERFGLPRDKFGAGDTPEQVASFRPAPELLMEYADAVHVAAMRRVSTATLEQLGTEGPSPISGRVRPAWESLRVNVHDFTNHTGQIAYLRGVQSGTGWMSGWHDRMTKAEAS